MFLLFPEFPRIKDLFARDGDGGEGGGDGGQGGGSGDGGQGSGLLSGENNGGFQRQGGKGEGGEGLTIPDKFMVRGEDGSEDWKAIAQKVLPSYGELEKRFRAGDAPPESADKYEIADYLPEGFERNQEAEAKVLGKLHELNLNNTQVQGVLAYYGELLGEGVAQQKASMEAAQAELKQSWGEDYQKNIARSNFALSVAPANIRKDIISDPTLMNNPSVIRLLEFVGREFEDDSTANQMGPGELEDIAKLRNSDAYLDPKHPDHKRVVAKVSAAYPRGYKTGN